MMDNVELAIYQGRGIAFGVFVVTESCRLKSRSVLPYQHLMPEASIGNLKDLLTKFLKSEIGAINASELIVSCNEHA